MREVKCYCWCWEVISGQNWFRALHWINCLPLSFRKEKLQGLTATESHLEVLEGLGHEIFVQVSDDVSPLARLLLPPPQMSNCFQIKEFQRFPLL